MRYDRRQKRRNIGGCVYWDSDIDDSRMHNNSRYQYLHKTGVIR